MNIKDLNKNIMKNLTFKISILLVSILVLSIGAFILAKSTFFVGYIIGVLFLIAGIACAASALWSNIK